MRTFPSVTRGIPPRRALLWALVCLSLHAVATVGAAADADPDISGDTPPLPADFEASDAPPATGLPTVVDTPGGIFSGPLVGAATDPPRYLVFDALAMQRNNALKDGPLIVENVTPQFTALEKNMLQSTVAPGARLLYGDYGSDGIGWETGYLGLWNMYSRARMESPNSLLQAPGGLGFASTAMQNGSQGDFTGITSLQSADVNVVFHQFDGGWNPRSPRPSQRVNWYDGGHLDWITGFRWAGLDDVGILGFTPAGSPAANTYKAHTSSNLFAGQVGVRGRMEFQEWALESWIKVGLA
ncbi:MAG: hypothetical protein EXS06_05725, partial [Planctomycetaceae bacterium]|nr:hypothetical protein [Planctomycetaceae bacterium]